MEGEDGKRQRYAERDHTAPMAKTVQEKEHANEGCHANDKFVENIGVEGW